jgi:hypothetical protein
LRCADAAHVWRDCDSCPTERILDGNLGARVQRPRLSVSRNSCAGCSPHSCERCRHHRASYGCEGGLRGSQ